MKRMVILVLVFVLIPYVALAEVDEPSDWAVEFVETLKASGEFREEAFTNFQSNITRSEFIYLAVRTFEILDDRNISPDTSIVFTDTDDIYAKKGATVGITSGIGENQFGPDELLTREQLAVLMVNVLKMGNIELQSSDGENFSDEDQISDWALESVYMAKAEGIVNGVGEGRFNPKGYATVEQALIIMQKLIQTTDSNLWFYLPAPQTVEGIEMDWQWDLDHEGELTTGIMTRLWQAFVRELEFTVDEKGIVQFKGYVTNAPRGFRTQMQIYVGFKESSDEENVDSWGYHVFSTPSRSAPFFKTAEEGEHFEGSTLGLLENLSSLSVVFEIPKSDGEEGQIRFELDYMNRTFTVIDNVSETMEFDWDSVFKW